MNTHETLSTEILFPEMPGSSKVWVYQANRFFTEEEEISICEKAVEFVKSWASHGSKLKADFTLRHHLFLIFSVDENQHEASGCSIDKSVHFIKEIENAFKVNFFDRTLLAYFDTSEKIRLVPLSQIKEVYQKHELNSNSLVFNNLPENLEKLRADWVIPMSKSWAGRFV